MLYNILLIVLILVGLGIIGLVLIQHGKGADAGAAFGGGASGTVFGSRGAGNFLSRSTGILAVVFFCTSLALAWLVANRGGEDGSIVDQFVTDTPAVKAGDVPDAPEASIPAAKAVDVPDIAEPASPVTTSPDVPTASAEPAAAPVAVDVPATADAPATAADSAGQEQSQQPADVPKQ